ncbi:vitellogenin-1-like isoform X2 [Dendrobates tinctorius]|uniref:vitellogenin-1-like isoform X2 n=1 Tax=Dendrobates tinctorius TaxID=92724 RepID=UPI003CC97038
MLGIILALSLAAAAAGSRHLQYELEFASSKTYIYDYEGLVLSGLQEQGFAKSGVKLNCRAEISGATPRLRFLKIHKIEIQEYNGIWPTDKFTSSSKLTRLLEKQLDKPIKFEYNRGQVGDLLIPDGLSETTVNILRGIVNILQLTIRKTHDTYILQENGIGGFCYNNYLIQEDQRANRLLITKSTDLNACEQRELRVVGDAYFHSCPSCRQRNKNSRAAATYHYKVKGTETGGRLLEAEVREVHQFTPFNEIEGSLVFEARQRLVLQAVQEQIHSTPENNDYITKESLRYHFERKLIQTPIHLLRTKNPESQINELLHYLVQHDVGPLSKASPEKFVELVKLLRLSNYENIVNFWKQFSGRIHYRRWFLDALPSIGNHLSLRFLKAKLRELSEFEAAQSVPLALHLITADREAIAEAKSLLEAVTSGHRPLLRKVAYLAYGSLVYKFCSTEDLCPEQALQPLYDLLSEATESVRNEDIILALKSLGNAGQVVSLKRIMKYIPRFSSLASTLSLPVQAIAVMSLKNIAKKHPAKVSDICLQLYMDTQQHPVIRMIAAGLVLSNKPTATAVMAVAKSLTQESDMNVGSFVYYLMKRQSESVMPDLQDVAAVCNMAVVILKSRYEAVRNEFHGRFHYDAFSDSLMSGIESTFNIIHNPADVLPVAALGRLKTYFMGGFTHLFEIGYHAEGLQELLMNRHLFSPQSDLQNIKKIMEILRKLHNWKPLSSSEPLATVYLRLFGQEILYHVINKNSIENILQFLPSNKYSALRSAVSALRDGVDINWSKPLLSSENRLVVPTCVGLPLETSLHYSSVTRAQLQVQAHIIPEPKDPSFIQLLQSNINLKSKFSLSMIKDIVFMFGVKTDLIEAGMELRTQLSIVLPGNVEAAVNVDQNHFKVEYVPIQQVNEVLSIRSKAFAVTRNAEDLAAAKMTPIVAAGTEPNVLKQTFNPRDLSAGDTPRTEGKFSAEVLGKENAYWSDQPHRQADSWDFSMCARTSHFGFQVCLEKNSSTAAYARNCPLYHVIGEHSLKLMFKPAHADASVEKIQIEFQAGPGAAVKMVRSVNVRRTDGETREMENPMDHVALSKLKKILGSNEETWKESESWNITSDNSSGNTTTFSMNSSSSAKSGHELNQEKTHNRQTKHKQHKKQQSKLHHKGQHKSQKPHQNPRRHHETDKIHDHKGHQKKEREMEVHCKCWTEEQQKHGKKQHGQVEDEKRHWSHEHHEDEAEVYEINHQKDQKHEKNKNPHRNPQDKSHHDGHESKNWQEGEERKHQHGNQKKGQTDEREDQKKQHQSHEHEKHITGTHEGDHKNQRETGKNKNPHKDAQDEDHHHADHQGPKKKNWQDRDDQQYHHKAEKEGQDDEEEDQIPPHKSQRAKEDQEGHHQKDTHERKNVKHQHKARNETEDHHDPENHPHQAGDDPESTGEKKHCTCWKTPKEDQSKGQHDEQEQSPHKGHHKSKCHHSQEHGKGDEEKCKFQSSDSVQRTKKSKGKPVKSSSSSSESSSQSIQEANPRKDRRKQQQSSSESSSSSQKTHNKKHAKNPKKPIESSRENPRVQQKHKNDPKHSHKIHWKTIRKSSKTKSADVTNCTDCGRKHRLEIQYDSSPKESSHYMELFAPQIHSAKFRSTSALQKSQRSSSSNGRSSSRRSSSSSSSSSSSRRSSSSSSSSSSRSSSGMNPLPYENLSGGMSPNFVFLVKSITSDAQHQGLQTTAYIDPTRSKAQVIAVPLNHKSYWKTCLDASVSGFHKASAMLRWGENCQDYRVVGKASTGKLAGSPAVQLSWHWKRLPTWLKSAAESLMAFVPGVAYTMGFSEMRHSNPSHRVTVQVAASSPDTYDTILKTPQWTFYKQAVPVPWDLSLGARRLGHLRLIELTNLPKVSSTVGGTHEAECDVDLKEIVTFDGRSLGCSVSPSHCYTVIAQDCTDQLRFLIAMKKTGQGFYNFEMNVKLGSYDIIIYSDPPEEFRVLLNGMWLLLKNDTYTNEKDCIRIHKNTTTVTVKAPMNGVELVAFNGQTAKVQISPLMHGRTCGLCGNADHCKMNDFQKPNQETARSCNGLVHSWTVPGNTCGSSCALGRQYIMLENERIEERQSTCYSVEPVLKCVEGCHPATTMPITVAFHCLPRESAMGLEDWRANPKASSEDLIKEVEAHTSCSCTEKCAAI